jgi:hypothetical protein
MTSLVPVKPITLVSNSAPHYTCTCASCGKATIPGKRFHVYNYDFCTIKCLIAWRTANPPKEDNSALTSKSTTYTEGWGNAF